MPTKVHLVKAMIFPVVMYGCESWTLNKAERWRIDAFELQCWRRLLRVPWAARRSNQSILKKISPGCSLDAEAETSVLWPPDAKSWLIWKEPDAVITEDEMVGWLHRLDGRGLGWTPGVGDRQGGLVCCSSWDHKDSDTTEQLNWLTDLSPSDWWTTSGKETGGVQDLNRRSNTGNLYKILLLKSAQNIF